MPEVIARIGRLAIAAALVCGTNVAHPRNSAAQDYPSRASAPYAPPDQAGDSADGRGRYASPAAQSTAGSAAVHSGSTKASSRYDAAATQAWPDEAPQRSSSAANEADASAPARRRSAGGPGRSLPVHFEPANATSPAASAHEATQASFVAPVPESAGEPLAAAAPVESQGPALALPAAGKSERVERRPQPLPSMTTLLGSLAVVLGLFLLLAWVVRMSLPKGPASLPRDAVEVLGRTLLTGRQYVHLIRCGNKMLLVAVTAGGAETLTEITDPLEVDRLAGLCFSMRPQSATANFRQLLHNFGTEAPPVGRRRTRREDDLDFSNLAAADQYIASSGSNS